MNGFVKYEISKVFHVVQLHIGFRLFFLDTLKAKRADFVQSRRVLLKFGEMHRLVALSYWNAQLLFIRRLSRIYITQPPPPFSSSTWMCASTRFIAS